MVRQTKLTFKNSRGLKLWVLKDGERLPENLQVISGGLKNNPTWKEYLKDVKYSYRPHFRLIRRAIIDLDWVGETGAAKANNYYFHFSDGTYMGFTWRAWGDLMQAIVNKREGYMQYYM